MKLLSNYDHHTLEAIMVYVLGLLFHSVQDRPTVRVSTLVDHLYQYVKKHAQMLKDRKISANINTDDSLRLIIKNCDSSPTLIKYADLPNPSSSTNKSKVDHARMRKEYRIGMLLLEFLSE